MKKIFVLQLLASTALLSAFNACSGGGSGNVAPILTGTTSVGGAYAGCSGTGINSEMSCQSYEVTSDREPSTKNIAASRAATASTVSLL